MATILVVEDDRDLRAAIAMTLEVKGHQVLEAANGQDALRLLAECSELPTLVLLDLEMPVMTGEDFLETVRGDVRLDPLRVIVMSGSISFIEGAGSWVTQLHKPFDARRLVDVVDGFMRVPAAR